MKNFTFTRRLASVLLSGTALLAVVFSVLFSTVTPSEYAYADTKGANGTVNIHNGSSEPSPLEQNSPKICTTFHIHGFKFDKNQSGEWEIYGQGADKDKEGTSGSYKADENGTWISSLITLPIGHWKLDVDGFSKGDKSKVFKIECELIAPTNTPTPTQVANPTSTSTPAPTEKPTNTLTPTPTEEEKPTHTLTPTPTQGSGSNIGGSSDSNNDSGSVSGASTETSQQGEILGATTLAATGTFAKSLESLFFTLAGISAGFASLAYAKAQKVKKIA